MHARLPRAPYLGQAVARGVRLDALVDSAARVVHGHGGILIEQVAWQQAQHVVGDGVAICAVLQRGGRGRASEHQRVSCTLQHAHQTDPPNL